ncbi:MAG: hypothetical protein K6U11_12765 [bacterium]|nr:hypothetical protein [bacterium]
MSRTMRFTPSPITSQVRCPRRRRVLQSVFFSVFGAIVGLMIPLSAAGEPQILEISFSHVSAPAEEAGCAGSKQAAVLQSGQIANLHGIGLLEQETSHWIHWSESQGSFEDTTGWVRSGNCWLRDNWECWAETAERRDQEVIFDSSISILGNQSYRNRLHYTTQDWEHPKEDPGKGIFHPLTWWSAPDSDQYFYRYYVRYSGPVFKWTNNSFKQFYVHNLFNMNACMWDDIPEGMGPCMYDIQGGTRLFVHLGKRMELDQWYCIELMVRKVGGGLELKFWLDGKECKIYDEYGNLLTSPWMDSYREPNGSLRFGPLELGTINCQNWTKEQLPVDQSIWFDGFAMSAKRRIGPATIVEIGNQPDYQSAKRVTQKLIWMKDDEIKFRTDLRGLGEGPYYLWVTNNRGELSKPYFLGGGSSMETEMAATDSAIQPESEAAGQPPQAAPAITIVETEPSGGGAQSAALEPAAVAAVVFPSAVWITRWFGSTIYRYQH